MTQPSDHPAAAPDRPGDPGTPRARLRLDIAALSDVGLVRKNNEDSYLVYRIGRFLDRITSSIPESELSSRFEDSGHLMVVADGMGGHQAGEVASRSALTRTLELILRSPRWALNLDDPGTREREIGDLLERSRGYLAGVHAALRGQAAGDAQLQGMGTTLTGLYVVGSDGFVLHVGDSKAFLVRNGAIRKVTRDHTVAQQYADLGVIPQDAVPSHPMNHMLTRAIGAPTDDLPGDLHHLRLEAGDRMLLCSDGLTDMAREAEILAVMSPRPSSEAACRALVDLALAGGGRDNVTVIVVGFERE
jgi:serine/threonine protein phosphatase PrpC